MYALQLMLVKQGLTLEGKCLLEEMAWLEARC